MKMMRIPHTDLEVSRISYGCMLIGGAWDFSPLTEADRQRADRVVRTALDQGITHFDHADIYCRGKSEAVFGELLQRQPGLRQQMVLQTKCGIRFADDPQPGDPGRYDFSYEHIVHSVEGSLSRLHTDTIDLLLLHRPDPLVQPQEVARAFSQLHASGKVRYFGVSNHTGPQIDLLQQALDQPLVVNQLELNLLHNYLIDAGITANQDAGLTHGALGLLDYCRLHEMTVQAWSPVAHGALIAPPPQADERVRRTAALVAELAAAKGTSQEAIVLGWLLRHPAGIQPVVGTTRSERVIASCQADGVHLSREEWYRLLVAGRGAPVP